MNKIHFLEKEHKYLIEAVSVSQIVENKHPFDKKAIPPNILKKAIIKGNCVHLGLELYSILKVGSTCNCEKEVKTHTQQIAKGVEMFKKLTNNNKLKALAEVKTYFYYKNLIIAGTIDLVIYDENDHLIAIVDWKTTKELHKEKYSLQLRLYEYILTKKRLMTPKLYIANVNRNELVEVKNDKHTETLKIIEEFYKNV